jgi:hypothetical protein
MTFYIVDEESEGNTSDFDDYDQDMNDDFDDYNLNTVTN